ncbi:replication endonuclease [Comamonadaceae bacterium PP-2]
MRTQRIRHAKPHPVFWMKQRSSLDLAAQVAQTARVMDARLRRTIPPQWASALDVIVPPRPKASVDLHTWNLERVDAMRKFEHMHDDVLHWSVGDNTVRDRARRYALAMDDLISGHPFALGKYEKLDIVVRYCDRIGVDWPEAGTIEGIVARACKERWWRRALRKKVARTVEHAGIKLGVVHRLYGGYASDEACRRRAEQLKRNAEMLKRSRLRNEAGQVYTLADLSKVSPSNRDIRRGELMMRIRGCEEHADAQEHHGVFLTLTCPSRFHAVLSGGKNRKAKPVRNPKYQGASPREAQLWLRDMWAKARAKLQRREIKTYGFRVAEPHHDGCPHWHALLWFESAEQAAQAETIIRDYWLSDDGDEPGALRNRCDFKAMKSGGAAGYVAKYVAKNIGSEDGDAGLGDHIDSIDGFEHVMDTREYKGFQRVDAWASTWGIRQFQAIGQPSVTVWREMRRVSQDQIEDAQLRLDFGDAAAVKAWRSCHKMGTLQANWRGYVQAQGGMCRKRREWMLRPAVRVTPDVTNSYGEVADRMTTVGVETAGGHWLVSRRQAWVSLASSEGAAEQSQAERAALGRPWTRFNNCTARLTGKPMRELLKAAGMHWPLSTDNDIEPPPAPKRPAPAPAAAPEPRINVIDGIRTTFVMPERTRQLLRTVPQASTADSAMAAMVARAQAFRAGFIKPRA